MKILREEDIILRGISANVRQLQKKVDTCDIKGIESIISQISIDSYKIDELIKLDDKHEQLERETGIHEFGSIIDKLPRRQYLQDKKDYREAINTFENGCKCHESV